MSDEQAWPRQALKAAAWMIAGPVVVVGLTFLMALLWGLYR